MTTISFDELNILLVLNGNKRIPHLEEEIFANEELTKLYLHSLCKDLVSYVSRASPAYFVLIYASQVMRQRWLAAEAIIAADVSITIYYDMVFGTNLSNNIDLSTSIMTDIPYILDQIAIR